MVRAFRSNTAEIQTFIFVEYLLMRCTAGAFVLLKRDQQTWTRDTAFLFFIIFLLNILLLTFSSATQLIGIFFFLPFFVYIHTKPDNVLRRHENHTGRRYCLHTRTIAEARFLWRGRADLDLSFCCRRAFRNVPRDRERNEANRRSFFRPFIFFFSSYFCSTVDFCISHV